MNEILTNTLEEWERSKEFPSFCLVQGAYGSGALKIIRDYARRINCNGDKLEMCACSSCTVIKEGVSRNYYEFLGDFKVNAVESFMESLLLSPDTGMRVVVFTIPGLSIILQNKLLKLFEEGLPRTIFIIINSGGTVLPAIKSRSIVLWYQNDEEWNKIDSAEFSNEEVNSLLLASGASPGSFDNLIKKKDVHLFIKMFDIFFDKNFKPDFLLKLKELDEDLFFMSIQNAVTVALVNEKVLPDIRRSTLKGCLTVLREHTFFSRNRVLGMIYMMLKMEPPLLTKPI